MKEAWTIKEHITEHDGFKQSMLLVECPSCGNCQTFLIDAGVSRDDTTYFECVKCKKQTGITSQSIFSFFDSIGQADMRDTLIELDSEFNESSEILHKRIEDEETEDEQCTYKWLTLKFSKATIKDIIKIDPETDAEEFHKRLKELIRSGFEKEMKEKK